jgi:hypothetical protein
MAPRFLHNKIFDMNSPPSLYLRFLGDLGLLYARYDTKSRSSRKERRKAFSLNFSLIPAKAWQDTSTGRKLTEEDSFHRMYIALSNPPKN